MLTAQQIEVIKATVPAVEAHGRAITEHFYPLMFKRYPQTKAYFNEAHQVGGTQRQALANAVIAYANNIDRLEALGDAVSLIAHKHCSLGIQPEHYPIVGECLMEAIGTVLGDAVTEAVAEAWSAAYQQLANILIKAENGIYTANRQRSGGWEGERRFQVVDKVQESEVITSFVLESEASTAEIEFEPGQYVTLIMTINGQTVRRNYSLSDAPGKSSLRISVKREPGGLVSNYLHDHIKVGDTLEVTAPCGEFVLRNTDRPLFLLTAGVGLTPTISMINHSVASGRDITFIHAALNSGTHAFADHINQLANQHSNLKPFYIYNQPLEEDQPHAKGYINRDILDTLLPEDRDVELYFLGPRLFMQQVNQLVTELEIPVSQVHFEFFGPLQELAESGA